MYPHALYSAHMYLSNRDNSFSVSYRELEEDLLQQLVVVKSLLRDPAQAVRVVAVQGTGRILGLYWDIFPSESRAELLSILTMEMVVDSKSIPVRTSAVKAIDFVVSEAHASHSVLLGMVKRLGALIHDK